MEKKKLPFNLQFFADEPADTPPQNEPENSEPPKSEPPKDDPTKNEPSIQDLMVELAKVKRAQEKAATEAAEYKKKWKESLSEQEQASMEKAEAQAKREEEIAQILRENKIYKTERKYRDIGWTSEEASKMAIAEVDNDEEERIRLSAAVQARLVKEGVAKEIASLPNVNIGGGSASSVTVEQFDKMTMVERSELKTKDPEEYERLNNLWKTYKA